MTLHAFAPILRFIIAPLLILAGFCLVWYSKPGSEYEIPGAIWFGIGILILIGPWRF